MKIPATLKRLLRPSLGKIGLAGMALCLALGMYVPPAPAEPAVADAPQAKPAQLIAQATPMPAPRH